MQIGLECFKDEQISSMIASENRHGECEIQGIKDCVVYDTEEDHYLEEYLIKILYLICDYPHKHYTFKHFEV